MVKYLINSSIAASSCSCGHLTLISSRRYEYNTAKSNLIKLIIKNEEGLESRYHCQPIVNTIRVTIVHPSFITVTTYNILFQNLKTSNQNVLNQLAFNDNNKCSILTLLISPYGLVLFPKCVTRGSIYISHNWVQYAHSSGQPSFKVHNLCKFIRYNLDLPNSMQLPQ